MLFMCVRSLENNRVLLAEMSCYNFSM